MLQSAILLPRSTLFPAMGIDILSGLRNAWEAQGIAGDISVRTDNITFGIDEDDIYRLAEKLVLQDNLDIVMVCADNRVEELLRPLFTAAGKILIMINMGANTPESWQPAPTTITHSLNLCMHVLLTSALAAQGDDKRGIYATSYYDGGYRQVFHMLNGHQIQGGIPVYTHVTHLKNENFTLEPIEDLLVNDPALKNILCVYSSEQAQLFYDGISKLAARERLQLFVSPMMLEESLLESLGADLFPMFVRGFVPWFFTLNNESNRLFCETIEQNTGKKANYFSLLGWEAGYITGHIAQMHKEGKRNAAAMIKACTEKTFSSPRGWLKIDPNTNYSYAPSYEVAVGEKNKLMLVSENNEPMAAMEILKLPQNIPSSSSGWRNTYLCI